MRTLRKHRETLAANPDAYRMDIPRAKDTIINHLRLCGFRKVSRKRCGHLVDRIVDAIFQSQHEKPFFHVESTLPFCWNAPKDWDKDYIRYEWGHLFSRNQNNNAPNVENLCLQSARCNQHIQTSMDINEVHDWLKGSLIADRIVDVLQNRKLLFGSTKWHELMSELKQYV